MVGRDTRQRTRVPLAQLTVLTISAADSENSRSSLKEPRYEVGNEKAQGHLSKTRSQLTMSCPFFSAGLIKMAKLAQLAALVGCVLLLLTIAVVNS